MGHRAIIPYLDNAVILESFNATCAIPEEKCHTRDFYFAGEDGIKPSEKSIAPYYKTMSFLALRDSIIFDMMPQAVFVRGANGDVGFLCWNSPHVSSNTQRPFKNIGGR